MVHRALVVPLYIQMAGGPFGINFGGAGRDLDMAAFGVLPTNMLFVSDV
jgi:hypothetical protein